MPSYNLNPDEARKAGQPGRINATGRYKGTIEAAWWEESEKGSQSFNVKFKSDDGQGATLATWTHGKTGQVLSGFGVMQAVMTCCELRGIESRKGEVLLYDSQQGKEVAKPREVYPALAGKKIGLFLEAEKSIFTYESGDKAGQDGEFTRMLLAAPFRYSDDKMAAEILDKKPKAEQADKYEVFLMGRKPRVNDRRGQTQHYTDNDGNRQAASGGGFDDDDIPF